MIRVKKVVLLSLFGLALASCNNAGRMSDEQIDSVQQAKADSLLQSAIDDTTVQEHTRTDSLLKDSVAH